jgi:hypothetical protein
LPPPEWADSVASLVAPEDWAPSGGDWIANTDDADLDAFVSWVVVPGLEVRMSVGSLDLRADVHHSNYREEMLRLRNATAGYNQELPDE